MSLSRIERFKREVPDWEPIVGEWVVLRPALMPERACGRILWMTKYGTSVAAMVVVEFRGKSTQYPFDLKDLRPYNLRLHKKPKRKQSCKHNGHGIYGLVAWCYDCGAIRMLEPDGLPGDNLLRWKWKGWVFPRGSTKVWDRMEKVGAFKDQKEVKSESKGIRSQDGEKAGHLEGGPKANGQVEDTVGERGNGQAIGPLLGEV